MTDEIKADIKAAETTLASDVSAQTAKASAWWASNKVIALAAFAAGAGVALWLRHVL